MDDVLEFNRTTENTIELLKKHANLVKRIAYHLYSRLPSTILIEDLVQTGMIGLNEAINSYDASKGASFTTYATLKIRGAILDELRSLEWVPRSVQDNSRKIAKAIRTVENRLGHEANPQQIADELQVDLDTYYSMLKDINTGKILDLHDPNLNQDVEIEDKKLKSPQQNVLSDQTNEKLAELIEQLPEKEKQLLSLYYFEECNFKEIGKVLNVSESRISQIHAQALTRLKSRLEKL